MFQSLAAELTLWVAIKCLDFYQWLNRSSFLITSVHFPGNVEMYPHAVLFRVQRAQNALLLRHRMKRRRKGEGRGEPQPRGLFWIDYLQTVCQQPDKRWILTGDYYL